MRLIEAIVLGLVQGLTEFLPISSSAHLVVVPWLLGWPSPGLAFDAALHLGTLAAVLVYFWRDLVRMAIALPSAAAHPLRALRGPRPESGEVDDPDARLALLIAVGTVPGAAAGLLVEDAVERAYHGGGGTTDAAIVAIAAALIGLGLLLLLAERLARHVRTIGNLRLSDALVVGVAQAAALVPGVSRSGATITAGLFRGLRRADAARFSFLLGVPIIAAAGVNGLADSLQAGLAPGEWPIVLTGIVVSGASGFAAIWGLLRYLQRASTLVFVVYRVALGLMLLAAVAFGR